MAPLRIGCLPRWLTVATIGLVLAALPCAAVTAEAQSASPGGMPPPPGMSLAHSAAMRFPQPVRVGDLLRRAVLQPVESRVLLGYVRDVVRDRTGSLAVVVDLGGVLGVGGRPIAIPVDAMVLLGDETEVVAFTPAQLERFPTFQPVGTSSLPKSAVIRIGLAKPSH